MMQSKIKSMKFINSKSLVLLLLTLGSFGAVKAQEIETDTVKKAPETSKNFKGRMKIDGVIATVGDYIILDSDIDKNLLEIASSGNDVSNISRCQMLGKLMEERLYAHQAKQDSIVVSDAEINSMMEEKIDVMSLKSVSYMTDEYEYGITGSSIRYKYKKNKEA